MTGICPTTLSAAFSLTPLQTRTTLGAVHAVLTADGPPGPRSATLLAVLATALEQDVHTSIATPEAVAAAFPHRSHVGCSSTLW